MLEIEPYPFIHNGLLGVGIYHTYLLSSNIFVDIEWAVLAYF